MQILSVPAPSRRSALRRAVELECAVHSPQWDGPAWYTATDVSPEGLWLRADLALDVGEPLMLSFRPPRWPEWCWPVTAFGEVVRVSLSRRRSDPFEAGMGVRFSQIDDVAKQEMALLLRGLPPRLPRRRAQEPAVDLDLPQALVLDDGSCFEFRAEGELLTSGRPAAAVSIAVPAAPASAPRPRRARARVRARELTRRPQRKRIKAKGRAKPKLRLVS